MFTALTYTMKMIVKNMKSTYEYGVDDTPEDTEECGTNDEVVGNIGYEDGGFRTSVLQ